MTTTGSVIASSGVTLSDTPIATNERIVVIGCGPVGLRFAHELLKRAPNTFLTIFGNEPYQPYNRVQLSTLLAGDIGYEDIISDMPTRDQYAHFSYQTNTIRAIDTDQKFITDVHDKRYSYDKLIIATGSRPHLPNIPGVDATGVYTFRNLKDAEHLYARRSRSRHIVVLGGGLLGLEAARALLNLNTKVTVVQQSERLMNRQLDNQAASLLQERVTSMGIETLTQSGVREVLNDKGRVTGVKLRNGDEISCDTVLVCAGIKANLEIARQSRIKVGRGILVDDKMQCSAPDVYAIGECCEHRGQTYGLVNPGFEQAAILADTLSGGNSHYLGSLEVSRLKVVGEEVCSMGEVDELPKRPFLRELRYRNKKQNIYRKLTVHRGKIIGSVAFGEWSESRRIQEAYQQERRIWPWQQLAFVLTGYVWGKNNADSPASWPETAIICQCNNISKQTLTDAISSGCTNASALSQRTGAGTVCGSCKPLLNSLTGSNAKPEKDTGWIPSLVACLLALMTVAGIVAIPALQVSDSVQTQPLLEQIWNDKGWKQVTGFSMLGMSLVGLLMSLRKRIKWKALGSFSYWRLLHIYIGVFCAATLILHTGLHLGSNLNQLLMLNFIGVLTIGAIAGGVISLAHTMAPRLADGTRKFFTWAHIYVTWPFPVLLAVHIITVYYF